VKRFWTRRFFRATLLTQAWPLLLFLLVILIPTACLLWFMNAAMQNERLAFRQRLADVYRAHLPSSQTRLHDFWNGMAAELEKLSLDSDPPAAFARAVQSGLVDSIILFDAEGRYIYPNAPTVVATEIPELEPKWADAARFENLRRDFATAAKAYEAIAIQATNANIAARARQAQARCFLQAGLKDAAIKVVTDVLGKEPYRNSSDAQGRGIAANAELMVLELTDPNSAIFRATAARLRSRLSDYEHSVLAAPQRRFLMKAMQKLAPADPLFPTLAAEEVAASYLEAHTPPPRHSALLPGPISNVWQFTTPASRAVALFQPNRLLAQMENRLDTNGLAGDVNLILLPPGKETEGALISIAAGDTLPGWHLALSLKDQKMFEATSRKRVAAYLWTGSFAVLVVFILALLAAQFLRRQSAFARLKNDLVATVSHELKTPLSSMRVLVDTLLDSPQLPEARTREYLQLIGAENERLSRLIENFLTFSRLERRKYNFHFAPWPAAAIANAVAEMVRSRFATPGCDFQVQIEADLPHVNADCDALVTALLNLLDNAYKYSEEIKHIVLRARLQEETVLFAVEDNGIGIPARETSRIFKDFYQVDQRLTRNGSGCGLGLSIVQSIVAAHHGTVSVQSQPGRGSTFTIAIPIASVGSPARTEAVA